MAEFKILELLSGEERRDEAQEGESPAAALDPSAAAAAMDMAKTAPALATEAAAYFAKQGRLVHIQTEHLHEQRAIALSNLKIRRFTDRLRAGTQVFFVALSTGFTAAALAVIYAAATSNSVVIDSFKAPPALAARGLGGDVVAGGVLDALLRLQDATRSSSKGLNTKSAWADEIKIELPETGISISEVDRLLHKWLGHDIHMSGDLVLTEKDGLALTVRGDGVPARVFQGAAGDLDKLTVQAAEYLYGRSQPSLFSTYLSLNGRSQDALAFIPGALLRASDDDTRASLARAWGNTLLVLGRFSEALEKTRMAISFKSYDWAARSNLIGLLFLVEGEEAAWQESQSFMRAAETAPPSHAPALAYQVNAAAMVMDLPLSLRANLADAAINGQGGTSTAIDGPVIADTYARMHDMLDARRYLAQSDSDDPTTKAEASFLAGQEALDRDDPNAALRPLNDFFAAWRADANLQNSFPDGACLLGLAQGLAGQVAAAEITFSRIGKYARCFAMHGQVLEHAGDLAGAEKVWSQGLAIGPDLSLVYLQRGQSELARGDLARAEADLSAADVRSPHFADPLKGLGDLRARQGRWDEAAKLYDRALSYAPAWPELLKARATSVQHR